MLFSNVLPTYILLWALLLLLLLCFCCFVVVVVVVIVVVIVVVVACHRRLLPVASLEPRVIPTALLSVLCVVLQILPSFVVNLLNVFLVWFQIFSLKSSVTIPVAPVITGIILHFRFHVRCISIHKVLYISFFPLHFSRHLLVLASSSPS